jgi:hypothetical protein
MGHHLVEHLVVILCKPSRVQEVRVRKECLFRLFRLVYQVQVVEVEEEGGPASPLQQLTQNKQDLTMGLELVEALLRLLLMLVLHFFLLSEFIFLIWVITVLLPLSFLNVLREACLLSRQKCRLPHLIRCFMCMRECCVVFIDVRKCSIGDT